MNILQGFKEMYAKLGGDINDLENISGNNDPNMISAIYGDGLNTKLPDYVAEQIDDAEGGGICSPNNLALFMPLYAVPKAEHDPLEENLPEGTYIIENAVNYGLSANPSGQPITFAELLNIISVNRCKVVIWDSQLEMWLIPTYYELYSPSGQYNAFYDCPTSPTSHRQYGCAFRINGGK